MEVEYDIRAQVYKLTRHIVFPAFTRDARTGRPDIAYMVAHITVGKQDLPASGGEPDYDHFSSLFLEDILPVLNDDFDIPETLVSII
jgi:hypothetical protein